LFGDLLLRLKYPAVAAQVMWCLFLFSFFTGAVLLANSAWCVPILCELPTPGPGMARLGHARPPQQLGFGTTVIMPLLGANAVMLSGS